MKSGIYKILNTLTGDFYIGSSKRIEKRWKEHVNDLTKNKHCNPILQRAWNKYKKENFVFELIIECPPEKLLDIEDSFLEQLPKYNIATKASGGDKFTNHPNRTEILKKMSRANSGSNNPNYQGKHVTSEWKVKQAISNSKVPIKLINSLTKEEHVFISSKEAAKFVGCSHSSIRTSKGTGHRVKRIYYVVDC